MKTILLTAVGSMAAGPALDCYRAAGYRVVGCDIYDRAWNVTSTRTDAFFQAKLFSDPEYLRQMTDAVQRYGADFLIPLTDPEVDALCGQKAAFAALGCTLCTPDEPVTRLCRAKADMSRALSGVCDVIPTFDPYREEPTAYPVMLKPMSGRSSQGQRVVADGEALRSAVQTRRDFIAQPYLAGDVWTVDVVRDKHGNAQALARRELLRNPSGLGMTVEIVPDHPLEKICAAIAQRAGVVGAVNMEFIANGGKYWFLEVNPRFSGGVGFSVAAGVNLPLLMLRCHAGEAIGPKPPVKPMVLARDNQIVVTA